MLPFNRGWANARGVLFGPPNYCVGVNTRRRGQGRLIEAVIHIGRRSAVLRIQT